LAPAVAHDNCKDQFLLKKVITSSVSYFSHRLQSRDVVAAGASAENRLLLATFFQREIIEMSCSVHDAVSGPLFSSAATKAKSGSRALMTRVDPHHI